MNKEMMEKLTEVLQVRMVIQHEQDEAAGEVGKYSEEEHVAFAIEEAYQNDELEFLTK